MQSRIVTAPAGDSTPEGEPGNSAVPGARMLGTRSLALAGTRDHGARPMGKEGTVRKPRARMARPAARSPRTATTARPPAALATRALAGERSRSQAPAAAPSNGAMPLKSTKGSDARLTPVTTPSTAAASHRRRRSPEAPLKASDTSGPEARPTRPPARRAPVSHVGPRSSYAFVKAIGAAQRAMARTRSPAARPAARRAAQASTSTASNDAAREKPAQMPRWNGRDRVAASKRKVDQ